MWEITTWYLQSTMRPSSRRRRRAGHRAALDRLLPLVYDELKAMAHRRLQAERPDHTLNTTALVHEAYLRRMRPEEPS
jgi:hypothetical protein